MSKNPDDLKYTEEHEWVKLDDNGVATVGITDHAQNALGDIVFVELPEEGSTVNAKDEVAVVESVKAASDVLTPISGDVIAINEKLTDAPETINSDPYDEGWFFKVQTGDTADLERELSELMDAEAYTEFCEDD